MTKRTFSNEELGAMTPHEFRSIVRSGEFTGITGAACTGYVQTNLVILPQDLAYDFILFAHRNPRPCYLLDATDVGNPCPKLMAPSADFDPTGAEADEIIDYLEASNAKLCFLALGAPKQEVFAAYARKRLGAIGFVSIGAGLDFISGTQTRAPRLLRWLALEWAWRLALNPGRLAGRYAKCFAILPSLAREALRAKPDTAAMPPKAVSGPSAVSLS